MKIIRGHDTDVVTIRHDLNTLGTISKLERYELLADLHRDDCSSQAGVYLLGDLLGIVVSLRGEPQIDVAYIIARIQLELIAGSIYEPYDSMAYCDIEHLNLIYTVLGEASVTISDQQDLKDIEEVRTLLRQQLRV